MSWDWATPAGLHTHGSELPVEGRLASFDGATGWLNSDPLTPAGLLGKVVLVDFWTYTCVNWLRQLPYVRAWADRYAEHGLVVVGVHTPEFGFERDVDNIRAALALRSIGYPVAIDSEFGVWQAFDNHYWPALYFADAQGRIRHHHYGEGEYEQSEMVIQQLLVEAGSSPGRERVSVEPRGLEVAADWATLRTPETYTGYDRAEGFASPEGLRPGKPQPYTAPAQLRLNELGAVRRMDDRRAARDAQHRGRAGGVPVPCPRRQPGHGAGDARDVAAVPGARRRSGPRARRTATTSTRPATGRWPSSGCTSSYVSVTAHRRPDRRDHLPRRRGTDLLLHVRLGRSA